MPEQTDGRIGARLRELRKRRGLTQRDLADHSGVSLATIRNLEQGVQEALRLETARKLASALRAPTSKIVRREEEPVPEITLAADMWLPVEHAVQRPPGADDLPEPTLDGVEEALQAARAVYYADNYAELATLLPPLVRDADSLGNTSEARDVRARLLHFTGAALTQVRLWGAADTALERALDEAPDSAVAAGVVTTRCWLLMRQGQLSEARELATKWADDLEPRRISRATPDDLAAWGWLLLHAAAAAVRDNREGEAAVAIRLAEGAAVMTGRDLGYGRRMNRWGPTVVAHKEVEHYVITDHPDEALKLAGKQASKAGARRLPSDGNANRHRLDVAHIHARLRNFDKAMETLWGVHTTAPSWLSRQQYARDILGEVVERRRTLTPEMRTLADAIRLPL
ncbi:helix-turn-helix domain-containing protein [Streptomyces hainanensis]|uniref:XRE family transcriptional regulator n=1 Tax=Streptomyces hainanensis TaxID=402648 RepID=A0A4R4TDY6_9ACTN|nr:helix-turn-helix transcriptional regulator [Streptomyces hainanensis]TDC73372.1 XRE family transcriptional regulator [Streptomyces hainanensis]